MLDSVTIKESVENLTSTAEIKLPATCYNLPIKNIQEIKRGNNVVINLGYNNNLKTEFIGYINNIETTPSGLVINCEDSIYIFRQTTLKDEVLIAPTIKDIINKVIAQVDNSIKLECDYTFEYDKFTIQTATGLDVLQQIQNECKCGIYFKENTLHVHPVYTENYGTAKYNMSKNVDRNGFSLKFKDKEDRKLKVVVKGKNKNGETIECKPVGEGGGDTITFDYKGITTIDQLTNIATEIYNRDSYTGYEGSFQSWLNPICHSGYRAELIDETDPELNGTYFVKSVETSVSCSGGVRKIELGKKI